MSRKSNNHKSSKYKNRGERLVSKLSMEFGIQSASYANRKSQILSSGSDIQSNEEAQYPKKDRS